MRRLLSGGLTVRWAALLLVALTIPRAAFAQQAPETIVSSGQQFAINDPAAGQPSPYAALYQPVEVTTLDDPDTKGAPAPADGSSAAMTPELQSILERLDALEKSAAKASEAQPAEVKAEEPAEEWVDMSAEKWTVKLGGHVQLDTIQWASADDPPIPAQNYFEFRRLRLSAEGTGYGIYDFRLQMDFEPEGEDAVTSPVVVVKDAFLTINEVAVLNRVRIGHFFVPFTIEQITSDTVNVFMERSIPTQGVFSADRELGAALYGINDAQDFTWTGGLFVDSLSEATKERIDDNQGHRVSGRVTWLPYYDEPSNGRYLVHTGAGVLHTDDQDNLVQFRSRPQIHEGPRLIDSGNLVADTYTSGNIELATVWGPASVQTELFLTDVDLIGENATLYGAYVYGSYFLTGESRLYERFGAHGAHFGRTTPFTNFFLIPGCHGWGAWEAKARYSHLGLTEVDRGEYNDLTTGFNWYWSDRMRVMFEWIHPVTSPDALPFGETDSDIIAMRLDFNW